MIHAVIIAFTPFDGIYARNVLRQHRLDPTVGQRRLPHVGQVAGQTLHDAGISTVHGTLGQFLDDGCGDAGAYMDVVQILCGGVYHFYVTPQANMGGLVDFFRQIVGGIQTGYNWLNKNIRDPVVAGIKKIPLIGGVVGDIVDPLANFSDKVVNSGAQLLKNEVVRDPPTWQDFGGAALSAAQLALLTLNPAAAAGTRAGMALGKISAVAGKAAPYVAKATARVAPYVTKANAALAKV